MSSFCGCWYIRPPPHPTKYYQYVPKQYLPLLESEVHSTILSTTSRTVLKQIFKNPSTTETIKECTYAFPLYDGVSVVSFTCRVGKKVLRGLVKEKAKAQEIYDKAVAKGETAGLLQQAPEASDMFSTKLGNIPAGESVIVEITYIGELKHHETEGIRFTIPTKIAPRYGSGPDYGTPAGITAQNQDGIKIIVDINMQEGSFIKGVQSPSHPIAVSMGTVSTATAADPTMSKASATLSLGSAALEKDFVLIVQSKDIGIPKAILETHPTIPNHRALMATLVPKFSLPPSRPEIVFVADRSGSMHGNIPMLTSAMNVFLKSMPAGVKFNICSFGSTYSFLWERSQSYTKDTLQQSTKHVQTFGANMGGTQTFSAIQAAIKRRWSDLPLEIILLTDGDIQDQARLFDYVNKQVDESKGKIRIFPLGIGNGVSHALIEGLARAGNGFSQAVQNGERLDNCVVRMLRGALTPHITDYTLEVKYGKDDDDFEAIDKVTEGLKVLLSDSEKSKFLPSKAKSIISLFDKTVDPEKESVKGSKDSSHYLPKVPTPKLLQAPHKIPSLFAFSRTSVYLLMSPETIQRNPTAVVLRATSEHGPLELEIPIEVLASPAETIHQLAAKKAVQDLEEGRGWIFDAKNQNGKLVKDVYPSSFDDLVQREAIRLGEKFQIVGKWCSFVAVAANDKEIAEKVQGGDEMDHEYDMMGVDEFADEDFADASVNDSMLSAHVSTSFASTTQAPARRMRLSSSGPSSSEQMQTPVFAQPQQQMRSSPITPTAAFGSSSSAPYGSAYPPPPPEPKSRGLLHSAAPPGGALLSASSSSPARKKSSGAFSMGSSKARKASPAAAFSLGSTRGGRGSSTSNLTSDQRITVGAQAISNGSRRSDLRSCSNSLTPASPTGSPPSPSYSPVSPTEASSFAGAASIADKVLTLIQLQDFEGFWASNANHRVFRIMDITDTTTPEGADPNVWLTILVVKFLQEKCAEEQGTWELVVEKAQTWLDGCGYMGVEELEKKASLLLG
ncbi:von Willebrand factor type A domain-containing protein [Leptodontidium sp. MPI-SDFR-AT-0119]|nr:von Willebrand factor type A domain-containing protein [Leptodontidium sp. MPI-SDFR-AT-0119]